MKMNLRIVEVNCENLAEYPPACFISTKNEGYKIKLNWLRKRFCEGMKIKVLKDEEDGKIHGFIEYVPGESAWRAVEAKGYLFIHCIWISPNKYKNRGYGSSLINECIKDASGKLGVAVAASEDSFMAGKEIFLKNGFKIAAEEGKHQLLVKGSHQGSLPSFKDYKSQLSRYKGWHIVYSNQCPWVARFVNELDKPIIDKLELKITELSTAEEAQNAPSIYSVFTLIHDSKILTEHYISRTRLNNIIKAASREL